MSLAAFAARDFFFVTRQFLNDEVSMIRSWFCLGLVLFSLGFACGCTPKEVQPDPSTIPDIPPGRSGGGAPGGAGTEAPKK